MSLKKIINPKSFKEMALATFYYTSGAIFGPLLFFGGLGYLLDNKFDTQPRYLIIGVFLAFATTNVLLFKKVGKINRLIMSNQKKPSSENGQKKEERKNDEKIAGDEEKQN